MNYTGRATDASSQCWIDSISNLLLTLIEDRVDRGETIEMIPSLSYTDGEKWNGMTRL